MLRVSCVILAKNLPSWLHLWEHMFIHAVLINSKTLQNNTYLKIGQCAELSQWKPRFFCPVKISQMMMAWGSSLVSINGLNVTTYLPNVSTSLHVHNYTFSIHTISLIFTSRMGRNRWAIHPGGWISVSAWTSLHPTMQFPAGGRWPDTCLWVTSGRKSLSSAGDGTLINHHNIA